ncbi:C3HC zinc finger-like-domain-containing protein [Irpex rosettiformis]|uniref:C3HC zinc finger-like-domain-containing protein n=1 Tax=Irpex rosettiformis TaxID=378272 RepID=A0ACB8TQH8_9APHY|nr:C3HC zinc finger-like-domain-containing protein [Irpex rosettiformis]
MEVVSTTTTAPSGSLSVESSTQGAVGNSERALKRKFEDALHVLDDAVRPSSSNEEIHPPPKKPRPSGPARSLYTTLAKYGIKKETKTSAQETQLQSLSKSAPHLVAILSRTATRARRANPFRSSTTTTTVVKFGDIASEYRPSSTSSFLQRLATYKLTTYANKPPAIDAVAAAKCGWVNDGKDRLVCGICNVSWVLAGKEGMNRDAANALVEKQRVQLVDMHKDGCPWKMRQCEASIYRVPLQTPAATAKELKINAIKLDSAMTDVQIKHPLTAAQTQALEGIIKSVKLQEAFVATEDEPTQVAPNESISTAGLFSAPLLFGDPSSTAIITALFGWSVMPPTIRDESPRRSLSRATSLAPSTPRHANLSATPRRISCNLTPVPSGITRLSSVARHSAALSSTSAVPPNTTNTTLLHCNLCQRRIGLWAFLPPQPGNTESSDGKSSAPVQKDSAPRRQLDVLKEHRSYCPYVVRSTTVPSLPIPPPPSSTGQSTSTLNLNSSLSQLNGSGDLEGWRAVLSVVLRYGAAQRQRLRLPQGGNWVERRSLDSTNGGERDGADGPGGDREVDPVAAMVEGVKMRGGRELLKYVKGLLG